MPFRTNFFGEKIIQPGTSRDEIDDAIMARPEIIDFNIYSADVSLTGDDVYGFGGTLHFTTESDTGEIDDDDCEVTEHGDGMLEFDGFSSVAEAVAWIDFTYPDLDIVEVA
jgi:hypothetical protein